uniref:adenylate cyclase n=1 Tax=Ditylenchus dipsaci TaxID=166011 RepID=A0A915DPX2_9BILA
MTCLAALTTCVVDAIWKRSAHSAIATIALPDVQNQARHAKCCVEMGLAMIIAIRQFDLDRGQNVNMRVGIHTGKVMCGMVGTKRFKLMCSPTT